MKKYFIVALLLSLTAVMPYVTKANDDIPTEAAQPVVEEEEETEEETEEEAEEENDGDMYSPPPPPEDDEDPDVPIDGGLSLLIAGGIGYGVKKCTAGKRKKNPLGNSV